MARMREVGLALALLLSTDVTIGRTQPPCPAGAPLKVPGAEQQQVSCLDDLTTAALVGTEYTDPADFAGLHAAGTENPSGVPGIQIDGYFPDTSTFNTNHGWNHDAQFVIRLPDAWNGKLVVTGAPGVRKQYSLDVLISDWVLARGYIFAATDKGNSGANFFRDSREPGDAVAEWHTRVTELTRAAPPLPRVPRYGRPGGPRQPARRRLRPWLGVPVGFSLSDLLGPDAADLPQG